MVFIKGSRCQLALFQVSYFCTSIAWKRLDVPEVFCVFHQYLFKYCCSSHLVKYFTLCQYHILSIQQSGHQLKHHTRGKEVTSTVVVLEI